MRTIESPSRRQGLNTARYTKTQDLATKRPPRGVRGCASRFHRFLVKRRNARRSKHPHVIDTATCIHGDLDDRLVLLSEVLIGKRNVRRNGLRYSDFTKWDRAIRSTRRSDLPRIDHL